MNFLEYRNNHFQKWQKIFLIICWTSALVLFLGEIFVFVVFYKEGNIQGWERKYFLLRVATPSGINFISLIFTTLVLRSKLTINRNKNLIVSLCALIICSVLAIFHNYFQFFMMSFIFPFILCIVFADENILKKLFLLSLIPFILASLTFFFDEFTGTDINKGIIIVCDFVLICGAFAFCTMLVKSQEEQIGLIYKNYLKQDDLIKELRIEPLTQLLNRKTLDETIDRVIERTSTKDIFPYIVVLDLDSFKGINDKYGHSCGDEVLIRLAGIIKEAMGGTRRAFRFGGDEFVLVFDNSSEENVCRIVEEIRFNFNNVYFEDANNHRFSISAGIAAFEKGETAKEWFNKGDEALYKAKAKGGNAFVVYE